MALDFSKYDERQLNTVDVIKGYTKWAENYDENLKGHLERPVLNALKGIDWDTVKEVADLACGTGRIAEWLLEKKSMLLIDGVDITQSMLNHARQKKIYRSVANCDMLDNCLESQHYDLVINVLAACHVSSLVPLYTQAMRLIRLNRWFILVDYHPFFLLNGIPTKFKTNEGQSLAIINYIHLISDHIRTGFDIGLKLMDMFESIVTEEWAWEVPGFTKFIGLPISFGLVWKKQQ